MAVVILKHRLMVVVSGVKQKQRWSQYDLIMSISGSWWSIGFGGGWEWVVGWVCYVVSMDHNGLLVSLRFMRLFTLGAGA